MAPYSSGDKSIKISHDFQEKDKELDAGLPRVALVAFAESILTQLVS